MRIRQGSSFPILPNPSVSCLNPVPIMPNTVSTRISTRQNRLTFCGFLRWGLGNFITRSKSIFLTVVFTGSTPFLNNAVYFYSLYRKDASSSRFVHTSPFCLFAADGRFCSAAIPCLFIRIQHLYSYIYSFLFRIFTLNKRIFHGFLNIFVLVLLFIPCKFLHNWRFH